MSLMNAHYVGHGSMHHPSSSPGTVDMLGSYWTDADAALLGGNSFLASVFQDCSAPSSIGHLMQQFPDLEDDDPLQPDISCSDARRNVDFLNMGDFPHIYITPEGVTATYGELCRLEGDGIGNAAPTNSTVSPGPHPHRYSCHDSHMELEAEGRRFDAAFRLEPASQSNGSLMDYGEACQNSFEFEQADAAASMSPEAAAGAWTVEPLTPSTCLLPEHHVESGQTLLPTPASTSSQNNSVFNSVNGSQSGHAPPLIFPGDSSTTISPGWRQPMLGISGFVDLSEFLSPQLTTSMHSSTVTAEQQRANLGAASADVPVLHTSTVGGHSMMASTMVSEATDERASNAFELPDSQPTTEEEQLRQLPVTFVSVRQDQVTVDPVKADLTGRRFMTSSCPASFLPSAVEQQLRCKSKGAWNAAHATPSCFNAPKPHPDHAGFAGGTVLFNPEKPFKEPKRTPVNSLAPVTPDKPRKRRTPAQRQQEIQKLQIQKNAGSPADHILSNSEAVPAKFSSARKLQKTVPALVEANSAFEQVGMMHTHLLETFLGGNSGNIVFPASKDLLKAGDHVARERRRRDLMNTRYQTLESLLPKLPCRRDRFGIVEDTKIYVKDMEKRLSELRKTKEESQARLEALKVAKEAKQQGNNAAAPQEPAATKLWCNDVQDLCNTVSSNVDVMVDQKDGEQDFVVLVQCRSGSGAKLIGTLLRALEKLQLDVSQCSTSRSSQTYFFSAVCKLKPHVLKGAASREKMIQEMVTTLRLSLTLENDSTKPEKESS